MLKNALDERYARLERLGAGGMGEVYLARDSLLGRDVALKVLREPHAASDEYVERFRREARHVAALAHPNIVWVYDAGETADGEPYMAMEYVPGGTLRDRLLERGALPACAAAGVAFQIADALTVAHESGLVHRDVKPENVLVTESGDVKVADFGIARAIDATAMTGTSLVLGTVRYLSPEQALGERVGPASDLYSLGVVLYEMLAGEVPFEAEGPIAIAMKHLSQAPVALREVNPSVPEPLEAVTLKLLRKHPEERYASAEDLARDLERFLAWEAAEADAETSRIPAVVREELPARRRKRSRRRIGATLLAVPLAAFVSIGAAAGLAERMDPHHFAADIFSLDRAEPVGRAVVPATTQEEEQIRLPEATERAGPPSKVRDVLPEDGARQARSLEQEGYRPDVRPVIHQQAPQRVSKAVSVPALAGMTVAEAEATLAEIGLLLNVVSRVESESVPEDVVLSQDVPPGYRAQPAATIAVAVSSGPPPTESAGSPENKGAKIETHEVETTKASSTESSFALGRNISIQRMLEAGLRTDEKQRHPDAAAAKDRAQERGSRN